MVASILCLSKVDKRAKGTPLLSILQSPHSVTLSKQISPQFNAVQQFYDAVTTWKFDVLESLFSEDYVSRILPASANVPPKNKTEGIQHAKEVGDSMGYAPLKVR